MNLQETIAEVLRLTTELHDSLVANDNTEHSALLNSRNNALQAFENCHRNATPAERTASTHSLRELQRADRLLREYCEQEKESLKVQANQIVQRVAPTADTSLPQIPLVDRKA